MPFGTEGRYVGQFEPKFSQLEEDTDLWWVVPFSIRYIVGVSGLRFSGKSTVQSYLNEKHGFRVYSLARAVRTVAEQRGIPLSPRRNLQDLGDDMRAEQADAGFLARLTLQQIRAEHLARPGLARIVVAGFKHPEEVGVFNKLEVFHLWEVRANDDARFARAKRTGMLARELREAGISVDEPTRQQFDEHVDRRDRHGHDENTWTTSYGQWVEQVVASGVPGRHRAIDNHGDDYRPLFDEVDRRVAELDAKHRRPEL